MNFNMEENHKYLAKLNSQLIHRIINVYINLTRPQTAYTVYNTMILYYQFMNRLTHYFEFMYE